MVYKAIRQMHKMLGHLDAWLVKAADYAKKKPFDANTLLASRLAPDQHPFVKQVQLSCDHAKFAPGRLTGKESPVFSDDEQTIDALHVRIRAVRDWLDSFEAAAFEGAGERLITLPRWEGKGLIGEDYMREYAMPNFYFHVSHSYAILRHNGIDLGKKDFVGQLSLRAP
jgi:hypothetical protein